MKIPVYLLLLFLIYSCKSEKSKRIDILPEINSGMFLLKSDKNISINNDVVFLKDKKYSGFLYALNPDSKDTVSLEGYSNGLLHGRSRKWYVNKQIFEDRTYTMGEKNGKQTSWWENGNKQFEFYAKNDKYEGELKEWAFDGKLMHLAHYKDGQEEGIQQLWYENGKIRANYVIINGKRYGLLGTKNCKNVSDSIFIVK